MPPALIILDLLEMTLRPFARARKTPSRKARRSRRRPQRKRNGLRLPGAGFVAGKCAALGAYLVIRLRVQPPTHYLVITERLNEDNNE